MRDLGTKEKTNQEIHPQARKVQKRGNKRAIDQKVFSGTIYCPEISCCPISYYVIGTCPSLFFYVHVSDNC